MSSTSPIPILGTKLHPPPVGTDVASRPGLIARLDEFEAYLRCGILEHNLAHFACRRCGQSLVAAWSTFARRSCG